ncbi:LuxR family transcriptional regulator [Bifidobacterium callitrichos]|uniref:LuxR family transcriptional regulator n=1 Tax=Bifidobacterium callitrichos TaxID=762209 RepID=A0A5M9Z9Z9_9BIFI|nr:helix-turn-helix transcriptional regulator [Bifidobacterium callitrichos]KAA8815329.1 LuxR family transcriptional regulator [Bifidobacterium callitrichos]
MENGTLADQFDDKQPEVTVSALQRPIDEPGSLRVRFPDASASDAHARLSEEQPRQTGGGRLSIVEQRILQLTSEGYSTEEIAGQLGIASTATIRSHTRNIREKLGARTLSHAVALWLLGDDD